MIDFDNGARAYVDYVLRSLTLTPTALAKRAGIASTTLTRFLNDRDHKFNLSTKSLQKIAAATDINPAPFLDGIPWPEIRTVAAKYASPYIEGFSIVEVLVAQGIWRERALIEKAGYRSFYSLPPLPADGSYFYAQIEDDSVGQFARAGELLWCQRVSKKFDTWHTRDNALLIVEERTPDDRLSSFTVRSIRISEDRLTLTIPSQLPPDPATTLVADIRDFDAGHVRILGEVNCVVRDLRGAYSVGRALK